MRRRRAILIGLTVASFAVAVRADEPAKSYNETIPGSAVRFETENGVSSLFFSGPASGARDWHDVQSLGHSLRPIGGAERPAAQQ